MQITPYPYDSLYGHASCKYHAIYRIFALISQIMENVRDAFPHKVRRLMNGRGVLTWYTGNN